MALGTAFMTTACCPHEYHIRCIFVSTIVANTGKRAGLALPVMVGLPDGTKSLHVASNKRIESPPSTKLATRMSSTLVIITDQLPCQTSAIARAAAGGATRGAAGATPPPTRNQPVSQRSPPTVSNQRHNLEQIPISQRQVTLLVARDGLQKSHGNRGPTSLQHPCITQHTVWLLLGARQLSYPSQYKRHVQAPGALHEWLHV
jgi:hypothetical protein